MHFVYLCCKNIQSTKETCFARKLSFQPGSSKNKTIFNCHILVTTYLENKLVSGFVYCIFAQHSTNVMLKSGTTALFKFLTHVSFLRLQTSQSVNSFSTVGFISNVCLYVLTICAIRKPVIYTYKSLCMHTYLYVMLAVSEDTDLKENLQTMCAASLIFVIIT